MLTFQGTHPVPFPSQLFNVRSPALSDDDHDNDFDDNDIGDDHNDDVDSLGFTIEPEMI